MKEFDKADWVFLTINAVCLVVGNYIGHSSILISINAFAMGVLVWKLAVATHEKRRREQVAANTLEGLQAFADRMKSGEPVYVTRVVRHETPDGPMHTFEPQEFNTSCEQEID